MKVAIYARFSSDNQRDASIADQFRLCRLHAEKQESDLADAAYIIDLSRVEKYEY